jgi:predicted nucleic acid-binding protein
MKKNRISFPDDFKLRMFIDTNVLIDYIENARGGKSRAFFNLLKKQKSIELVTSDFVLWEFYGYFRKELYARKLVKGRQYNLISAHKECSFERFENATFKDIETFGNEINGYQQEIEKFVMVEEIIKEGSERLRRFNETVRKFLQCSKFSYKDTLIFASALYTRSHMLITSDKAFSKESHLKRLKKAIKSVPPNFTNIAFKRLNVFLTRKKVAEEYKNWFEKHNKNKIAGDIVEFFKRNNVIHVKSKNNKLISRKNSFYLVKFVDNKMRKCYLHKISADNFKDHASKNPVEKGVDITIKLPSRNKSNNWKDGWVFLAE